MITEKQKQNVDIRNGKECRKDSRRERRYKSRKKTPFAET